MFSQTNANWLDDYSLFAALKESLRDKCWVRWPAELRQHKPTALAAARQTLADSIAFHRFVQWLFERQWTALKTYCNDRGIGLIGDIPIFIAHDSAAVWARQDLSSSMPAVTLSPVRAIRPISFRRWDRCGDNGPIEVHQPRVNDKRVDEQGQRIRFTSKILPPYLRKTKAIEELVPWLYLKGISTSDFPEALSCLGHDGSGLSPTTIVRMKEVWQGEYENFCRRSLAGKRYVYLWADGIYFNIRLTDDRPCVLVLMGATEDGTKELIAMIDGQRESEQSWLELLVDAKDRGLTETPMLATGDGALGFWKALKQVYPGTRTQRCWVHKTVNVLDKLAHGQQVSGKKMLHEIWMAATKQDALKALGKFAATYQAKFPKAVECLLKDQEELLAFYDFPAEHWRHLRTEQPDRKHLRHGAIANL